MIQPYDPPEFVNDAPAGPYLNDDYFNELGDAVKRSIDAVNVPSIFMPDAFTDWSKRDDGVVTDGAVSDSGNTFHISRANTNQRLEVINGRLECEFPGTAGGAVYFNESLPGKVNRIGATFGFGPSAGANTSGNLALVTWDTPYYDPATTDAQIHFGLHADGWFLQIIENGSTVTNIASDSWATALTRDWRPYTVELAIHGTVLTMALPNGQAVTLNHSKFQSIQGNTACWEPLASAVANPMPVGIYAMWAAQRPTPAGFGAMTDSARYVSRAINVALGQPYPPVSLG